MAARLTLYARVEGSETLNEIITVDVDATVEPIHERRPGDDPAATARLNLDLPAVLRDAASRIEHGRS